MTRQIPGKIVAVIFFAAVVGITFFTPIGAWRAWQIERAKIHDELCNYNYCMNPPSKISHYENESGGIRDKKGYCEDHAGFAPTVTSTRSSLAMVFLFSLIILAAVAFNMILTALKSENGYSFAHFFSRFLALLVLLFLPWLFVPVYWH
jgi:hypothetical protein